MLMNNTARTSDGSFFIIIDSDGDSSTDQFLVERGSAGAPILSVEETGDVTVYGPVRCDAAPLTFEAGASNTSIARFCANGQTLFGVTQDGAGHFPNGVAIPCQEYARLEDLPLTGNSPGEMRVVIITESYFTPYLAVWAGGAWHLFQAA